MRRRSFLFLSGSLVLQPLGVAAQTPLPIIGFLFVGNPQRSKWWVDAWIRTTKDMGEIPEEELIKRGVVRDVLKQ